jgi:hypothetical protein
LSIWEKDSKCVCTNQDQLVWCSNKLFPNLHGLKNKDVFFIYLTCSVWTDKMVLVV